MESSTRENEFSTRVENAPNASFQTSNKRRTNEANAKAKIADFLHSKTVNVIVSYSWIIVDVLGLILILLLQGSVLNYFLIYFHEGNVFWYFSFLIDFCILILFMLSIAFSKKFHRYEQRHNENVAAIEPQRKSRVGKGLLSLSFPKAMGTLPLIYVSWLLYALALISKIVIIYKQDIPKQIVLNKMKNGTEILELTIASAALVFLLWVEAHHNERDDDMTRSYIKELTAKTVFEIFDSIAFIDLITPDDKDLNNLLTSNKPGVSSLIENIVIFLSSVNFLLPTLGLLPLSGTKYKLKEQIRKQGVIKETVGHAFLGLCFTKHVLRLFIVDIPFLIIRIHLSANYDKEISIFILKNIMGIITSLRSLSTEYRNWLEDKNEAPKKSKVPAIKVHQVMDGSGNQEWELPVLFGRYKNSHSLEDIETIPSLMEDGGQHRNFQSLGDRFEDINLEEEKSMKRN